MENLFTNAKQKQMRKKGKKKMSKTWCKYCRKLFVKGGKYYKVCDDCKEKNWSLSIKKRDERLKEGKLKE